MRGLCVGELACWSSRANLAMFIALGAHPQVAEAASSCRPEHSCCAAKSLWGAAFSFCPSKTMGLFRELNRGPLAPEARIIPLDQAADGEPRQVLAIWKRRGPRPPPRQQRRALAINRRPGIATSGPISTARIKMVPRGWGDTWVRFEGPGHEVDPRRVLSDWGCGGLF